MRVVRTRSAHVCAFERLMQKKRPPRCSRCGRFFGAMSSCTAGCQLGLSPAKSPRRWADEQAAKHGPSRLGGSPSRRAMGACATASDGFLVQSLGLTPKMLQSQPKARSYMKPAWPSSQSKLMCRSKSKPSPPSPSGLQGFDMSP